VDVCTDPVRATSLGFPPFCVLSSQVDRSRDIVGLGYAQREKAPTERFETVAEIMKRNHHTGSVLFPVLTSAFPARLTSVLDGLPFAETARSSVGGASYETYNH